MLANAEIVIAIGGVIAMLSQMNYLHCNINCKILTVALYSSSSDPAISNLRWYFVRKFLSSNYLQWMFRRLSNGFANYTIYIVTAVNHPMMITDIHRNIEKLLSQAIATCLSQLPLHGNGNQPSIASFIIIAKNVITSGSDNLKNLLSKKKVWKKPGDLD